MFHTSAQIGNSGLLFYAPDFLWFMPFVGFKIELSLYEWLLLGEGFMYKYLWNFYDPPLKAKVER